jgi:sporulation protein YlmC with PRC-barrel domain
VTAPIEDISSLPGKKVSDQQGGSIGEVKDIYATEGDGQPMWVAVEGSFGTTDKRIVLIPLARLKEEDGEIGVPYSKDRIGQAPEVDVDDGISAECDRQLRGHYGIGVGDQELRGDNKSYATLVPEEEGAAKRVEDVDQLQTADPDKRTDESMERLHDSQRREARGGVGGLTGERAEAGDDEDTARQT